jgi:hypothetical protein
MVRCWVGGEQRWVVYLFVVHPIISCWEGIWFIMYSSFIVDLDKDLLELHEYINYGKVEITLTM